MANRLRSLLACLFFAAISVFLSAGDSHSGEPLKVTMENGLTVIVEEESTAPVVAIQMWVNIGSADEKEAQAGIAHVFEHMLFKGTKKRGLGEIAGTIEALGGDINAYTSYENTVYHLTIPSRHFLTGLDIISDSIQNSAFDPEELKKELQVVLEEIRMNEDNPERNLYRAIFSTAYTTHPYKRPVIGYAGTVSRFTRDDILGFFKTWYAPNNMTLVIAGDIDRDFAVKEVQRLFKDFRKRPLPKRLRKAEPPQASVRAETLQKEIKQAHLGLAFHIPGLKDQDTYALDVLAGILGGGESSRLYKRLKIKDSLVYGIGSYAMSLKDPGLFFITATLEAKASENAVKTVFDEITRLSKEGPGPDELQKVKLNLESEFVYSRETMDGIAGKLGYYQTYAGGIDYEKKYIDGIRAVDADAVRQVIKRHITPENLSIGLVEPKGGATLKDALMLSAKPTEAPPQAKEDSEARDAEATMVRLSNGITLIVKEVHSNPTVAFYAAFPGGLRAEDSRTNGAGNLLAEMLTRGTRKRTREELTKEIEEMAGGISGFSGWNSTGASGKFLSRFFEKGLNIFADVIKNPALPEAEIQDAKKDIIASIKRQEDYLPGYTFKLLYKALFNTHPYGMPVAGTIDSVSGLKREDILAHYERVFAPERMVIAIVGDINKDYAIGLAEEAFKDFKNPASPLPEPLDQTPLTEPVTTGDIKEKSQTNIGLGFIGGTIGAQDSYALKVLAEVLAGQGGRLFVNLRDRQSLAYSVTAFSREGIDPGIFAAYIATSPDKKDTAVSGIMAELKDISENKVTDEELKRAKNSIAGSFEIGLQDASSQASSLANNVLYGLGLDYVKEYPKRILEVTSDDVLNAAKRHITPASYAISIVGPPDKGDGRGAEDK